MNPDIIAAIVAGIPTLSAAIVAIILAIKGQTTATGALNSANAAHQRLNQAFGQTPVEKDPS